MAVNLLELLPRPVVLALIGLLVLANTINIGTDLSAMGVAGKLVIGASEHVFTIGRPLQSWRRPWSG